MNRPTFEKTVQSLLLYTRPSMWPLFHSAMIKMLILSFCLLILLFVFFGNDSLPWYWDSWSHDASTEDSKCARTTFHTRYPQFIKKILFQIEMVIIEESKKQHKNKNTANSLTKRYQKHTSDAWATREGSPCCARGSRRGCQRARTPWPLPRDWCRILIAARCWGALDHCEIVSFGVTVGWEGEKRKRDKGRRRREKGERKGRGKNIPHHPHFTPELTKHFGGCVVFFALFGLIDDQLLHSHHLVVVFTLYDVNILTPTYSLPPLLLLPQLPYTQYQNHPWPIPCLFGRCWNRFYDSPNRTRLHRARAGRA